MGFQDLDELFDDTLPLPVGGKVYRVPAPDAELGLWCQRMLSAGLAVQVGEKLPANAPPLELDDADENAFYRRLLGSIFDELIADGVSWPRIQIIGQTAFLWVASGLPLAEQYWNSAGNPEALPPPRRSKKASGRSGGGSSMKKLASTNGTKSRRTGSNR